jgi:putative transposase
MVVSAAIQDRDGAKLMVDKVKTCFPHLEKIWADGGYAGALIEWVKSVCGWVLEIVKRSDADKPKGFVLLARRWIVERTFGWLNRSRRLSKDYERMTESSEAFVYLAMIHLMTKRLARQQVCFG